MFKCIFYFPVVVTFSIFGFLVAFYVFAYIYPTLKGDYEGTIGVPDYWANDSEKENDKFWCEIILVIFAFLVIQLFLAIILTINTDPGSVPQDREYDLPDDMILGRNGRGGASSMGGSETTSIGNEHDRLLNDDII